MRFDPYGVLDEKACSLSALMSVEVEVEAGAKAKPKAKGKAKAKRGRKIVWFEKCSWAEVSARPQALTTVTSLLLTADSFHSH